jgi:HEAT repeat protein
VLQQASIPQALIPALIEGLKDEDETVRANVGNTLLALGDKAAPDLVEALKADSKTLRAAAAAVLGRMGNGKHNKLVLTALVKALKDKEVEVRRAASAALIQLIQTTPAAPLPPPVTCYPAAAPCCTTVTPTTSR